MWKSRIKKTLRIVGRTLTGRHGIYGRMGKHNHVRQRVIVYENAVIGHDNYLAPGCLVNNARIGNYNSLGPGSMIGMAEHDLHAISTYPRMNNGKEQMQLIRKEHPAIIEHDVWVGANAVIRQGVHIAAGAVIGANAVVTHDVEPYEIVTGVPARPIGYRFDEEERRRLLDSGWFNLNFEAAQAVVQELDRKRQRKKDEPFERESFIDH